MARATAPPASTRKDFDSARACSIPGDDETLLAWWESHYEAILHAAHAGGGLPEAEELDEDPRPLDRPPIGPVVLAESQTGATRLLAREARGCERCSLYADQPRKQCSAKVPSTPASCSLGSSRAIRKISLAVRSLGQRDNCWTPRWRKPASTGGESPACQRSESITNSLRGWPAAASINPPSPQEIEICRFWLDAERTALNPTLLVLSSAAVPAAAVLRPARDGDA